MPGAHLRWVRLRQARWYRGARPAGIRAGSACRPRV